MFDCVRKIFRKNNHNNDNNKNDNKIVSILRKAVLNTQRNFRKFLQKFKKEKSKVVIQIPQQEDDEQHKGDTEDKEIISQDVISFPDLPITSSDPSGFSCSPIMVNPKTRTWPSIPSFSLSSTGSHSKVSSTHSNDSFHGVQEYSCHHPDGIKTTFHRDSTVLSSRKEFTSKYLEEEMLGQGGFSQVYAGDCWSDFTPVAIKHIPKKKVQFVRVNCHGNVYNEILEVVLMKQAAGLLCDGSFENPAVIGIMDIFDLESEVIIVMERLTDTVDGYDYYTQKRRIPEDQVKVIFKQIVNISLTMHKNGIFHRDLKLNNILVNSSEGTPEIRVIDFGCGDFVENEPFKDFCGTPAFSPPEVLRGETYMAEPTTVWQIGAMMYIICARTKFDTLVYMKRGKKVLKNVSKQCNDFLNKCLALNPKNRATLEDLRLHPWLK